MYGPRWQIQKAFEDDPCMAVFGVGSLQIISIGWYVEYFIPQLELLLAARNSEELVRYDRMMLIRKVVDLEGNDLPPNVDVDSVEVSERQPGLRRCSRWCYGILGVFDFVLRASTEIVNLDNCTSPFHRSNVGSIESEYSPNVWVANS
jgi:hypothetical protein